MNETNMLKEIREIDSLRNCCEKNKVVIPEIANEILAFQPHHIMIVARGTSLHAGIYAQYLLELNCHIPVSLANPSVFTVYDEAIDLSHSLVIAISQSGKGYDVSTVLKKANEQGAYTLAITNNPNSIVAEAAKHIIFNEIGETLSGAATKGFTSTLYILTMLTHYLSKKEELYLDTDQYLASIEEGLLHYEEVKPWAHDLTKIGKAVTIARGMGFSIAKEFSLKLMETCLYPVISFPASEFCHGPLACTSEETPAFLFAFDRKTNADIKKVMEYLKDTKAPRYLITNDSELAKEADHAIIINEGNDLYAFFSGVIVMQLLASEMSFVKGTYLDHVPVLKGRTNTF